MAEGHEGLREARSRSAGGDAPHRDMHTYIYIYIYIYMHTCILCMVYVSIIYYIIVRFI